MNTSKITQSNIVHAIINYEDGNLTEAQTIQMFAQLIRTGQVWGLQGHYGRTAQALIDSGYVTAKGTIVRKKLHYRY